MADPRPNWLEQQAEECRRYLDTLPPSLRDQTPVRRGQHRDGLAAISEGPELDIALSKAVHDLADERGVRVPHDIGMTLAAFVRRGCRG